MQHTPGPWSRSWISGALRHVNRNVDYDGFWFPSEGEDREAANIPSYYSTNDVDLIAAAPDLYEALCDMVSDRECLSDATIRFAQRALAKARGETL